MKKRLQVSMTVAMLLLAGCKTQAERLYDEALANEQNNGLPSAVTHYQSIVSEYPESPSADRARVKLLEHQRNRDREALQLFNQAEGKSATDAISIYQQVVAQYADTEVAATARARIERIEAEQRAAAAARVANTISDQEFVEYRQVMERDADPIGRGILSGTHPTGTYLSTDAPTSSRAPDGSSVTTRFTVNWKGGILEIQYRTVYAFTVRKVNHQLAVDGLEVTYDDAILKVDPSVLRAFEQELTRRFANAAIQF